MLETPHSWLILRMPDSACGRFKPGLQHFQDVQARKALKSTNC